MARDLRVLVLASKAAGTAPAQRYRFEQWAPWLEREHGVSLDLHPFESPTLTRILYEPGHLASKAAWVAYDFARRFKAILAARSYHGVLIVREAALIGPAIYERLFAWTGKPILFDFDDAIWMQQPEHKSLVSLLRFQRKTKAICRLATAVTAGNPFLAAFARKYNSSVSIVPSTIDLDDYPLIPEAADKRKFIVCWTGSATTLVHFEQARTALEQVAARIPLVVKIICSKPPERPIGGAEMRFVRWSAEREAEEVGDCHVGIMPLPDNEFSRGKCGMKALQYMATGRPVVVSPVGVNTDIVREGENGYLAATDEEWVEALMTLAASAELRARLGSAGRQRVERDYSAPVGAAKFAAALRAIV